MTRRTTSRSARYEVVTGRSVIERFDTAIAAEARAAQLRAMGWKAFARDREAFTAKCRRERDLLHSA